ncbi:MAG TPA: ribonuclease HII [Chitinophagaceae bacterium]
MLRLRFQKELTEAGCDEAGRGCLAGPVFAAAVILPPKFYHPLLNDSKQVAEKDRYKLRKVIEKKAVAFAVGVVDNNEIDLINILNASFKAMHLALEQLEQEPQLLLIDGNRFNAYRNIRHECIIQGDEKFSAIAAASILAKTYRDDYMKELHSEFSYYGWYNNKGYGTREHCKAIEEFGLCKYHRRTFDIKSAQLELFDL